MEAMRVLAALKISSTALGVNRYVKPGASKKQGIFRDVWGYIGLGRAGIAEDLRRVGERASSCRVLGSWVASGTQRQKRRSTRACTHTQELSWRNEHLALGLQDPTPTEASANEVSQVKVCEA